MERGSLDDPFDAIDEDEMDNMKPGSDDDMPPTPPRPASPHPQSYKLPWTPKVRYVGTILVEWLLVNAQYDNVQFPKPILFYQPLEFCSAYPVQS